MKDEINGGPSPLRQSGTCTRSIGVRWASRIFLFIGILGILAPVVFALFAKAQPQTAGSLMKASRLNDHEWPFAISTMPRLGMCCILLAAIFEKIARGRERNLGWNAILRDGARLQTGSVWSDAFILLGVVALSGFVIWYFGFR